MIYREAIAVTLANDESIVLDIPVAEYDVLSVQGVNGGGSTAWSTAVVSVRWRNSINATPLDFASAKTITGPGGLEAIDVSGVAFVTLQVTTAQADTRGSFFVVAKNAYRSV